MGEARAYYNEHDPFAAAWLRELIKAGHIAPGDVDERDIREVQPDDVNGYTQAHFFAGIGGWSLALRLAGWPDDRPVWTGSCPCQPFSAAGKNKGADDARHLWPDFFALVRECRPVVCFGEQVEGAVKHGWLDGISADLEGEGYAFGAVVLGAHSVAAPHIRQRLFWVADARHDVLTRAGHGRAGRLEAGEWSQPRLNAEPRGVDGRMADAEQQHGRRGVIERARVQVADRGRMGNAVVTGSQGLTGHGDGGREPGRLAAEPDGSTTAAGCVGGLAHAANTSGPQHEHHEGERPAGGANHTADGGGAGQRVGDADPQGLGERTERNGQPIPEQQTPRGADAGRSGFWSAFDLIPCRDGKARRIEPGTFPLAHGVPARVGRLRGYGNAIVPQVAATFIQAYDAVVEGSPSPIAGSEVPQ